MENGEVASKPVEGGGRQGASNGLKIATGVACVVAVVGIVAGACFYMDASRKASENATLRAQVDLLQEETGAELVEQTTSSGTIVTTVKSNEDEVKELMVALKEELEKSGLVVERYTTFGDGGIIKIPGSEVYTSANQYYGVVSHFYDGVSEAVKDQAVNSQNDIMVNYLTLNGFSKVMDVAFGDTVYGNFNTGVYCIADSISMSYGLVGIKCSYEDWYNVEDKDLLLTLAGVVDTDLIYAQGSRIKDSQVSPYQTIDASNGYIGLLFYRVSPSSEWQFFASGQMYPDCSAYNTQDLKNAFAGERCWDEATQSESTVQP